jgi:predicted lipoprotein with Yx(FWY)xxD motif
MLRFPLRLPILLVAALFAIAGCGSSSSSGGSHASSSLVAAARNATLRTDVLVDTHGMTLYTLSAERAGHFICTRGATVPGSSAVQCLSLWHPLLVSGSGISGAPVSSLGVVKRPDGVGTQVTYRGMPLYSFAEDTKPGDVRGNGFKDVGTWLPATVGSSGATAPASPSYGGAGY